jgi:hypothetical protein
MPNYFNFKETLASKPRLMTLEEIKRFKADPNKDYYMSIFAYNDNHKKHVDQTGSVAGIKDVKTNTLVFDFDSKDLEKVKKDVLELGTRLIETYEVHPDNIACFFSGSKGLHVVVPLNKEITPEEFKQATVKLAENLDTFDPVVSDPQRVLRVEHTKHPKTGLYKIPLHIAEVDELSIDQIKQLAKTPREDFKVNTNAVNLPETLFKVIKKEKQEIISSDDFDYTNPPKGWKKYKYALAQGWFDSGERHNALMVIAATCRGLGYDKEQTYFLCKSALKKQARRTGGDEFDKSELWENIIEQSVFSNTWEGGQYSPQNNPWLKKYCERMNFSVNEKEEKVIQLDDIELGFTQYVQNIEQNTVLTGIPCLDKAMPLTTGMNLGVIGAASSGKTALALSILKNTSKAGVVSVFASLDMHRNRLFEKLLYKTSGLSRDDLYKKIKEGTAGPIFEKVREEYKNVYFYDRSAPTVDNIREYINQVQEQTGKKVKMVMLDYFERVNSDKSEDTAASKEVAGKLQDLVNDFDICMVTLVQPNKFALASGPDSPITNYTAIKGSSFLYQSFRSIISIWRPFFNPEWSEYDKFLQMAILKNDLGELNMFNFGWHGKKGEIWELAQEGEEELERLIKMKNSAKSKVDEGNNDWS